MAKRTTKKTVEKTFSFDELLEVCKHDESWKNAPGRIKGSVDTGENFHGTKTYGNALDIASNGYPEGVKMLTDAMGSIGHAQGPVIQPFFDVAGDEPDIDRFLNNEPDNMVTYENVIQDGINFIDVYFSYAYGCVKDQPEIIARGVQVLSNIDNLEQAGYRVRLIAYHHTMDRACPMKLNIIIKDYNEHVELDRMAFIMIHPSMLRRLGFRLVEIYGPALCNRGYGSCSSTGISGAIDIGPSQFEPESIDRSFELNTAFNN